MYNHGNMQQIYPFAALAALIILWGHLIFMTLSTARASLRSKEIGVRKVNGAKRKKLITQFLSESLVQAFILVAVGAGADGIAVTVFNMFVEKDITLQFNWQTFVVCAVRYCRSRLPGRLFFCILYVVVQSAAGLQREGQATGKKGRLIKGLVCLQFVIAITMIICTTIIFKQLHYLQNADLGLNKEHLIEVDVWTGAGEQTVSSRRYLKIRM